MQRIRSSTTTLNGERSLSYCKSKPAACKVADEIQKASRQQRDNRILLGFRHELLDVGRGGECDTAAVVAISCFQC